jgi:8-oxo-dGTP diphosphatase
MNSRLLIARIAVNLNNKYLSGVTYISKIFVTVDLVIVKQTVHESQILLIKRKNEPFKGCWALPGGFVDEKEDLEQAAFRELFEETQLKASDLKQIGAFGNPNRDPRGHMVSVAYFGTVHNSIVAIASDDAQEIGWYCLKKLPELAFDHAEIISEGITRYLKVSLT